MFSILAIMFSSLSCLLPYSLHLCALFRLTTSLFLALVSCEHKAVYGSVAGHISFWRRIKLIIGYVQSFGYTILKFIFSVISMNLVMVTILRVVRLAEMSMVFILIL